MNSPVNTPVDRNRVSDRVGALTIVVALWVVTRGLAVLQLAPSNDIDVYFRAANDVLGVLTGSPSTTAHTFEYPPLALVLVTLPRLLVSEEAPQTYPYSYAYIFAAFILVFDALNVWLTSRLSHNRLTGALLYIAAGAVLGEVLVQRLDAAVAMTIALALALALTLTPTPAPVLARRARRPSWLQPSEVVLALGALLKLVPILALPAVLIARRTRGPAAVAASASLVGVAAVVGLAPFLVVFGPRTFDFVAFHAERGVQIESVPASVLLLLRAVGLVDVGAVFQHGAMHLTGGVAVDVAKGISTLLTPVVPVAVIVACVWAWRRREGAAPDHGDGAHDAGRAPLLATAAVLLAVLVTAKVLSPQFLVWLLPPLCALASRTDRPPGFAAAVLLAAVLTGFIAKFAYRALIEMDIVAVVLLAIRNGVLVWLLLASLRWLRSPSPAQPHAPSPSPVHVLRLSPPLARMVSGAALFVLVVVANARDVSSTDFWLHRRIGEDILATGVIPRLDVYAATTIGAAFVAHEWLAGVLLHLVDSAAGSVGLVLLRIALVLAIVAAGVRAIPARLRWHPAAVPIALAALAVVEARTEVRPHLFALACLAVLVAWTRRSSISNPRSMASSCFVKIAVLHIAWANLHASVFLGPAMLAVVALIVSYGGRKNARHRSPGAAHLARARARQFALAAGVALLASFINPRGPGLLSFALSTSSSGALRASIHEWKPLWQVWSPSISNLCFVALFTLLVVTVPFLRRARREERAWIVISLGLCCAAVIANRFQAEAAVVGAPVVLAGIARASRALRLAMRAGSYTPTLCVVLVLLFVGGSPLGTGYGVVPDQAVRALIESSKVAGLRGAILNEYNDGGYLISELPPELGLLPTMDGRFDVHGAARFEQWRRAWRDPASLWRYANDHGVVAVIIDASDRELLPRLRHDVRWRVIGEDPLRVVFVRSKP